MRIDLPIEEIIEKRNSGMSNEAIAEEYNVSRPTILRGLQEYYKSKGKRVPKILKKTGPLREYIKRGIPTETIKEIAEQSDVIIPENVLNQAIKELEEEEKEK